MNGGWLHERGLFWKEWREKRWLAATIALSMVLVPVAIVALGGLHRSVMVDEVIILILLIFSLGVLALGARFLSREEEDPARAFLYTLPLSRSRIVAVKLGALAGQWALLAFILLALAALLSSSESAMANEHALQEMEQVWHMVSACLLWSLPGVLLAAIFGLHLRSTLVTVVFALLFCIPVVVVLSVGAGARLPGQSFWEEVPNVFLFGSCVLAAAMLAGWLFFLFCRTAIQEMGNTSRVLLALLFGVGAVEVIFTVFLCNYRDLIFILFGI